MSTPAQGPWKTAFLTGASSGLGRGLAVWLAKRGVKVYAAARRTDLLNNLKSEVGDSIVPVTLDVSDSDATFDTVARLDAESGGFDLVIANAGIGGDTRPKKPDWKAISTMIDINVSGATATLCGALEGMVQRGKGQLVGVSSLAGLVPLPRGSTYCASKAYLGMFLDSLRLDVEKYGLVVTSIHPGFVKTELTAKIKDDAMPFLLETDDAVERMGKAMLRQAKVYAFPWQLSSLIGASVVFPRPIKTALLRKLR